MAKRHNELGPFETTTVRLPVFQRRLIKRIVDLDETIETESDFLREAVGIYIDHCSERNPTLRPIIREEAQSLLDERLKAIKGSLGKEALTRLEFPKPQE